MTTIAIVCGYDLHTDLRDYVRRIAGILEEEQCDALVLSGGRTSPLNDDSEAQAMTRALAEHLPNPLIILEERAMTTLDNILYARQLAEQIFAVRRYVVACDRVHAPKVMALSAILLRRRFVVRAVPRKVPLAVMLFEPVSFVIEVAAALLPFFRTALRTSARKIKGLSGPSRRSAPPAAA
ncbi:MAG TPA: YdcF family protein [Thermoanaerobaculia bacterium]